MGFPGSRLVGMIIRAMEVRPRLLVMVSCPYCEEPDCMELDPSAATYWCRNCSKAGRLESLERHCEAEFVARHRAMDRLMRTPPGFEREGRFVPVKKKGRRDQR